MSKKNVISRLSLAALALPGLISQAEAGRAEETYNTDAQYAHYEESGGRMQVDVAEISAAIPIAKAYTLALDFVSDTISGASPMFNMKDAQGQVQQVLSGASITEQRYAGTASLSYAFDDVSVSVGGGVSSEHDYLSNYINAGASWDLNKKLTTLNVSVSAAFDEVSPTGYNYTKNKTSQQYLLGVTQIIDKNSLLQSNMTFSFNQGFLSDPYKLVFVQGAGVQNDNRPEHKFQWAWLTRYVRNFKALNKAALHADYRLYVDDWGVTANMLELSWFQPIAEEWQIIPRFRYYTQDQADFYSAVFDSATVGSVHSSDYRLAGFGALSGGVKLTKNFQMTGMVKDIKLQAAFDYYDRKASYQIGGNHQGSFADYSFYMVTASINVKF